MYRSSRLLRGALGLLATASLAGLARAQTPPSNELLVLPAPTKGDVNLDSAVDVKDAYAALQGILGLISLSDEQRFLADMSNDNVLNVEDVVGILKTSVGIIPQSSAPPVPAAEVNGDLNGLQIFPADNEWNRPVDGDPVDPDSDTYINSIGEARGLHPDFGADDGGSGPFGIPYVVVSGVPGVPVNFNWADESDAGPYPIPENAPVEGGPDADGDRHVIVVDRDHGMLYETYNSFPGDDGWTADSGAAFDLNSNAVRPEGWTSADAAGLPIFPGLVRYEEVAKRGEINHALRFTVRTTQKAYVFPARHYASSKRDPALPPMGMRVRLKADFDITSFPASAQVILRCLKKYGMILADNGGNWFISGAPDERWIDDELNTLKTVTGGNFEVVQMGGITKG